MAPPRALLHGLIPFDGTIGLVLDVLFYLSILLAALAVVLIQEEDGPDLSQKLRWGLFVVAVPLVGPVVYLLRRSGWARWN